MHWFSCEPRTLPHRILTHCCGLKARVNRTHSLTGSWPTAVAWELVWTAHTPSPDPDPLLWLESSCEPHTLPHRILTHCCGLRARVNRTHSLTAWTTAVAWELMWTTHTPSLYHWTHCCGLRAHVNHWTHCCGLSSHHLCRGYSGFTRLNYHINVTVVFFSPQSIEKAYLQVEQVDNHKPRQAYQYINPLLLLILNS